MDLRNDSTIRCRDGDRKFCFLYVQLTVSGWITTCIYSIFKDPDVDFQTLPGADMLFEMSRVQTWEESRCWKLLVLEIGKMRTGIRSLYM